MSDATAGRWRRWDVVHKGVHVFLERTWKDEVGTSTSSWQMTERIVERRLNELEDALAAAEAKAALADEVRHDWLVLGPMLDGWSVRAVPENTLWDWLARYTELEDDE